MRLTTTLAAAAVIAVSGVAANAGGLQFPAQNEVTMITPMAPTGLQLPALSKTPH